MYLVSTLSDSRAKQPTASGAYRSAASFKARAFGHPHRVRFWSQREKDESARDFNNRLKEHEIEKSRTTGILQQSLSRDIILDVEYLEEPQDILAYLKNRYEPSALAHQFAIYQEWQSVNYDGKGLEEFTHKYSQACARLKEFKLDVSDIIKV